MIYWLSLIFCIIQRTSFAYPDYYNNMPEVNPYQLGSNGGENYEDYSESRFEPQSYPWKLNSEQEMPPAGSNFLPSGINDYSNENNIKDLTTKPSSPHQRNMKLKNTLKMKSPSNVPKFSHSNRQQEVEEYDDYETDKDAQKRRDIGKSPIPPISISGEISLDPNRNLENRYQNKWEDGSLSNVYLPDNLQNGYPETTNSILEGKSGLKLENNKPDSGISKAFDETKSPSKVSKPSPSNNQQEEEEYDDYETDEDTQKRRGIGKSPFRPISSEISLDPKKNLENRYQNKRNDASPSNVYLPENSQNGSPETTNNNLVGKSGFKLGNRKPDSYISKVFDDTRESVADSNFNDNEDTDLESNLSTMQSLDIVFTTDEAMGKGPESITKIYSQNDGVEKKREKLNNVISNHVHEPALEKNLETSSNSGNGNDYIDSSSNKRKDNLILRDTSHTSEYDQKFPTQLVKMERSSRGLNKTTNSQAVPKLTFYNDNQSSTEFQDMGNGYEFSSEGTSHFNKRRMANGKGLLGKLHFSKRHKKKRNRDSQTHLTQTLGKGSNYFHESTKHEKPRQRSTNDKQYINLKVKKSVESNLVNDKNPEASQLYKHRNSAQSIASDNYINKERPVEMTDITTEKENAIHFEKYIDNQVEAPDSSEMKQKQVPFKTAIRNSNKFQTRNRMKNYNRQNAFQNTNSPLISNSLSYRKSLQPSNPYSPYSENNNSQYGFKLRNKKRATGFPRASSIEIKQLDEPHSYELNIAKRLNNKKAKVDEKLFRTVEDHKVKKTILKDGKNRKETDIIENENEKVVDNVHVISDPNQITTLPLPASVDVPFLPERPINSFVDQDKLDEEENSEEQAVEPNNSNLNINPNPQIAMTPAAETEEMKQSEPQQAPNEDYYEESNKEEDISDNNFDASVNQANDAEVKEITQSENSENKYISITVDPDIVSDQANHDDYSEDSDKLTEIPSEEDVESIKVANKYSPTTDIPLDSIPEQTPTDNIHKLLPPERGFPNLKKNGIYRHKYKLPYGKGKKHKKIYRFSTEYAVSDGMDEFEKEEKLEKASKTVVRNKLMTANESSHHFQEKKTEIKNNKESYHEAFIEEKDESKVPRNMESSKNFLQRSAPISTSNMQPNSDDYRNSYSAYTGSTAGSNNLEPIGDHEYDDQSGREYSGRISERYSPSDELKQNEDFIEDVKRSQPTLKIIRDANTNEFVNETQTQGNLQDASSLNGLSGQGMHHQNSELNLEGITKEAIDSNKDAKASGTPKWTSPDSESKSGNVVYITLKTTTMDAERKYHDFIQIQDGKSNEERYERHPRHYIRKRRKNRNTEKKSSGP